MHGAKSLDAVTSLGCRKGEVLAVVLRFALPVGGRIEQLGKARFRVAELRPLVIPAADRLVPLEVTVIR